MIQIEDLSVYENIAFPLKYQKNENLEKKYYKLITQSRNERFIEEIDEKCQCYLKMPFKNLVCASPEELEQLHSNVKDRTDYGQMKDAFKHISSIKQNNYIVSILFQICLKRLNC